MRHKIAVIASALFMALTLTACGSVSSASAPGAADHDRTAVQEQPDRQETTAGKSDQGSAEAETVTDAAQTKTAPASDGKKILVAYFSRADENYNVGTVAVGNTQIVAEYIADAVGADSFHIETVTPYPADYDACCDVARKELAEKARPEIQGGVENMEQYDIVFLGYPIWWGDMPMAVYTFMDSYPLSDKIIIPFCTHEGSGLSGTDQRIADCTGAQMRTAIAMRGSAAQAFSAETQQTVREWLDGLGFR